MREARMLRRLIRKIRQPKLPYPPQPLKLRRVNQTNYELSLVRVSIYADDIMNRIAVYSFSQISCSKIMT